MVLALSSVKVRSSELADSSVRIVKDGGVRDLLKATAIHLSNVSQVLLFRTLFGSITRDELVHRAKARDRYWEYGSPEAINIRNQERVTVPELFSKYSGSYAVERPFVCELGGGLLINGSDPFVLTDRKVVMETEKPIFGPRGGRSHAVTPFHLRTRYSDRTKGDRMRELCLGYARSRSRFHKQAQFEAVFPLFRRDTSYGHWLLDQLPTLRGLCHYTEATGENPTIIIESNPPNWVRETLSLVGVDNVVPLDVPVAKADRLIVASCRESVPRNQSVYEPSKDDINWLSREMKSRASPASTDHPDRIYISRENLGDRGRYVTNRKELKRVLDEFGVTICTPETRSVAEQIRLFENAELIMGPHGAGLINMIFSEHTTVVELLGKPYPMYQHLSQLCGHDYRFLQCEGGDGHHTPIEVDIAELRELLARIDV